LYPETDDFVAENGDFVSRNRRLFCQKRRLCRPVWTGQALRQRDLNVFNQSAITSQPTSVSVLSKHAQWRRCVVDCACAVAAAVRANDGKNCARKTHTETLPSSVEDNGRTEWFLGSDIKQETLVQVGDEE